MEVDETVILETSVDIQNGFRGGIGYIYPTFSFGNFEKVGLE